MGRILASFMIAFGLSAYASAQSVNPFPVPERANSRSGGEGLEERLIMSSFQPFRSFLCSVSSLKEEG